MTDARILVTGSRAWTDDQLLADVLLDTWHDATQLGHTSIVIVHGGADGADTLADLWARGNGLDVEVREADWDHCADDCSPEHRRRRSRPRRRLPPRRLPRHRRLPPPRPNSGLPVRRITA